MKDRFKFRVWNSKTKRYIEPCSLVLCMDASLMTIEERSVGDEYIIEQCTGLKDKNGKLIFEGDLVKMDDDKYKVIWLDEAFKYEPLSTIGVRGYLDVGAYYCTDPEIIGNIHDNPELLEEK